MSDDHDALISQFLSFTNSADPDQAASYLEMSGYNLETAVGLFLEHATGSTAEHSSSTSSHRSRPARDDDVRAPDQTRTMRLMDDDRISPTYQLMTAMMDMDEAPPSSAFAASAVAITTRNARAALDAELARGGDSHLAEEKENYEYDDDDDEEGEYGTRPNIEPPRLADMFAAPEHMMHRAGGFLGARTTAKDSRRWLLVNIQRDSVFASHALNRDVWRDELVENLIREGFIFWQQVGVRILRSVLM